MCLTNTGRQREKEEEKKEGNKERRKPAHQNRYSILFKYQILILICQLLDF